MIAKLTQMLRVLAAGKQLARAIEKNDKAAGDLDAILREVLKR